MHPLVPELVCFNDFAGAFPLVVDAVYADAAHPENFFKTALYKKNAALWGHKDLVAIVLVAALILNKKYGFTLCVKDCLRPIEAQAAMGQTPIVQANLHWVEGPVTLISKPGSGGHPRGMAVDVTVLDKNKQPIDMGTAFDYFTEDMTNNPAARDYTALAQAALKNRRLLEDAMLMAADKIGRAVWPLPQEWWDFRFYPDDYNAHKALSDADLPPAMQMVLSSQAVSDFPAHHRAQLNAQTVARVRTAFRE